MKTCTHCGASIDSGSECSVCWEVATRVSYLSPQTIQKILKVRLSGKDYLRLARLISDDIYSKLTNPTIS